MKGRIVGLWVCALVITGCNNDVQKPAADRGTFPVKSAEGGISIVGVVRDDVHREITASVVGEGVDARLRIAASNDSPLLQGMTAELLDASGELLFSITSGWNADEERLWIREETATDYLVISTREVDERVIDEYDANGDVAVFEYPLLSYEAYRHAGRYYQSGQPASHLPADVQELIQRLGEFDAYYAPHATSSLHDNPDGELLVHILTETGFNQFITGETPDPDRPIWLDRFCSAAWLCARLKCLAGGIGNPVCLYCSNASLACAIISLGCSWIFSC